MVVGLLLFFVLAAHTRADLDFALHAFKKVGSKLGLI